MVFGSRLRLRRCLGAAGHCEECELRDATSRVDDSDAKSARQASAPGVPAAEANRWLLFFRCCLSRVRYSSSVESFTIALADCR